MAVINGLAYSLFSITFVGLLLLYFVVRTYLTAKSRQKISEQLNGVAMPLGIAGIFIAITGVWNMLTWPLSGSYNILFYDPYVALGLLLVAFAYAIKHKIKLEYIGFWSLLAGIMTIVYGINGYGLGMTSSPIALLGLYSFFGIAAILACPMAYLADRLPGMNSRLSSGWKLIVVLFALALIGAIIVAGLLSVTAIAGHLPAYANYTP